MLTRCRIQNQLIDLIKAGRFIAVEYEASTGKAKDANPDTAPSVSPISVTANETEASFDVSDNRRGYLLHRTHWLFTAAAAFNVEVSCELFEQAMCISPPILPRLSTQPQVIIQLLRTNVIHPVRQQSTQGTVATFQFDCIVDP